MGDGFKFGKDKDGGDRIGPDHSPLLTETLFGGRSGYDSVAPRVNSTSESQADNNRQRQPGTDTPSPAVGSGDRNRQSPYDAVSRLGRPGPPGPSPADGRTGGQPAYGTPSNGRDLPPPPFTPSDPTSPRFPIRLPDSKGLSFPQPSWLTAPISPRREAPSPPAGQPAVSVVDVQDIARLNAQIAEHEAHNKKQSYLGKFASLFYRTDEDSFDKLKELSLKAQSGDAASARQLKQDIEQQIKKDQAALTTQDEIGTYGTGFLKTAGLFLRGKLGLATTIGFYALDQMKPSDPWQAQLEDAGWGTTKGLALRGTLNLLGKAEVGIAAKGVGMGVSSRLLELGLNRETYWNAQTGERDWLTGLRNVTLAATNPQALASDVITFAVAHGAFGTANRLTGNALAKSPFLSTVLTGGTFGLSSGMTGEIMRQQTAGEKFDIEKILKRGAIQGSLDALAAAPGGFQSDAGMRSHLRTRLDKGFDRIRPYMTTEFDHFADRLLDKVAPDQLFDKVHINPPRPEGLKELGNRLVSYSVERRTYQTPIEGAKGPFKDYTDFSDRAVKDVDRDYRVYTVTGHDAKVLVPEDFARQLDDVRRLRLEAERDPAKLPESEAKRVLQAREDLRKHPLRNRLLPEELLPLLDELPERGLVKNVYLNNEADPQDPWHSQVHKRDFRAAASASAEGDITFYQQDRGSIVRENLFHEWAHLHKYAAGNLSDLFDKAALLEKDGHYARDYGRTNDHENWAVNMGEELLHLDGDRFFIMARRAPLRAAVWGRAMQERMNTIPPEQRSPYHEQFIERLAYLETTIVPRARKILLDKLKTGDLQTKTTAFDLLPLLADATCIEQLKATAKNSGDEVLSFRAFALAERLMFGDKIDFYVEMAQPGSAVARDARQRLKDLPDMRAQQAYTNLATR